MCLTPWINGITFLIEACIALWLFSRAKKSDTRIAAWIVVFLALYQLSSFFLCITGNNQFWNLMGYFVVTWLPAMGYHLYCLQTKHEKGIFFFYAIAAFFTIGMLIAPVFWPYAECDALFISYHNAQWGYNAYGAYYLLTIIFTFILFCRDYFIVQRKKEKVRDLICLIGLVSFTGPAYFFTSAIPAFSLSFPSLFCFFAVFLAICLVLREKPELFV